MRSIWINNEITYDGTQLRSRWIKDQTGVEGDAIAAFIGPADVPIENMVDLEDVANNAPIFSKSMLNFIAEHFNCDLALAVARQRLLVCIATEELILSSLRRQGSSNSNNSWIPAFAGMTRSDSLDHIKRVGDDIYDEGKKLSVSIATSSPISSLIHFALNIESEGTPVPTKGLSEYSIEPRSLADKIAKRYCEEIESMENAKNKVRAVE